MHVVFISESQRKAIVKVNAILDSYAVRIGQQAWVSPMTQEGLQEIHVALRRIATRQTAVACYQNDGRKGMKLLWIVGRKTAFSQQGAFPVHTARQSSLQKQTSPPWQRVIALLAESAGLVHDLGKYSQYFQQKLRAVTPQKTRDAFRHEWISLCVLRALQLHKYRWEEAWKSITPHAEDIFLKQSNQARRKHAPYTLGEVLEFIVVTHHRLFANDNSYPTPLESHRRQDFPSDAYTVPFIAISDTHLQNISRSLQKLSKLTTLIESKGMEEQSAYWWAAITLARAGLIFADHTVSAQINKTPLKPYQAAANTHAGKLNQSLDWHLENVAHVAGQTTWRIGQYFAHPEQAYSDLDGLQEASLAAILEPADENSRFHWQNIAAQALSSWRHEHKNAPCLVFTVAGTGSGKTRSNIRNACVLSQSDTVRCSIALNLRSLTLQTGKALEDSLGILSTDIATIIGDSVTQKLFQYKDDAFVDSDENAYEPEFYCHGETVSLPSWMQPLFTDAKQKTLISTPLLVSTIDFLDGAGNPHRQGHHVKAFLRVLTSDIILDEIDSYEPEAFVSVLRLIQLCAFFKRNLICSSATLSQSIADAVHAAWQSGLQLRQALLQQEANDVHEQVYGVAFIDDTSPPKMHTYTDEKQSFSQDYAVYLQELITAIHKAPVYRRAFLQKTEPTVEGFYTSTLCAVQRLHTENAWNFLPQKRISFGLIRMANIQGAVHMARCIAHAIPHAYVACYHANDWRINRHHKEQRLDFLLTRKDEKNKRILQDAEVQKLVSQRHEPDVLFIVVATPVEEVGRDHDFDWAVIEPSSAQSIVQTAGRVNRHRMIFLEDKNNIAILQYNLRHCKNIDAGKSKKSAFIYPGYEIKWDKAYVNHDLQKLLPWNTEDILAINAALRLGDGSAFAQADDACISKRVTKFFGSRMDDDDEIVEGIFTKLPIASSRMSTAPYKETPLRSASYKQEWRMCVDKDTELSTFERLDSDGKKECWVGSKDLKEHDAVQNAWLCLSPVEMLCLCEKVGINEKDGLFVELTVYEKNGEYKEENFVYDKGFGIYNE